MLYIALHSRTKFYYVGVCTIGLHTVERSRAMVALVVFVVCLLVVAVGYLTL